MFLKSITVTDFSLTDLMSRKKQYLSLNFTSYVSVFTPRVKGELTEEGGGGGSGECKIKHQAEEKMEMKMHDLR